MPLHRHISTNQGKFDATGVGLSVLCIAHCLLLPAAAAATPMLVPEAGALFGLSHDWHLALLALAAPVSLIGLGWSVRTTRAGWPIFLVGLVGLAVMATGASHLFSPLAETALTLTGVTILAGAHFANWRSRAKAGHVHERDCGLCDDHAV
ncbi:hypothetical protein AWH62_12555 [Maricaulis sp. W15]|uniref:MerC domain-containing protein n=1 Tax=Maricaulis sp. W15 TaxID=1772333 RepID=UPI000948DD47|nr:MerC domain-containing protein [Maricaulis sp. W15]OLF71375.1 hypothetical protein AWH62_12555 [Maricaulis sp. W15]